MRRARTVQEACDTLRQQERRRPVLLADQDRRRWDHRLIEHGLAVLARTETTTA